MECILDYKWRLNLWVKYLENTLHSNRRRSESSMALEEEESFPIGSSFKLLPEEKNNKLSIHYKFWK